MKSCFKWVLVNCVLCYTVAIGQNTLILNIKDGISKVSVEENLILRPYLSDLKGAYLDLEKAKTRSNPIFNTQLLFLTDKNFAPRNDKPMFLSEYNRQDWFHLEKEHLESTKYEFKHDFAIKWLEAWDAKMDMKLNYEAINSLDSLLKFSSIDTSSSTYLRYVILDDQYDMYLLEAQSNYSDKIKDLKFTLGFNDSIVLDTNGFYYQNLNFVDSVLIYGNKLHPSFKETAQAIQANKANLKLQKSLALVGPEVGLLANPQNKIPYFGVFFTQPLPVFDRNQQNIEQAKVDIEKSSTNLQIYTLKQKADMMSALKVFKVDYS
jgi:outer membrane protein, heavy metal efflux system